MARSDVAYVSPEDFETVEISMKGCEFVGTLYEREAGGFDLYFSMEPSDYPNLPTDQISLLRKAADDNQEIFIETFPDNRITDSLKRTAKKRLEAWIISRTHL